MVKIGVRRLNVWAVTHAINLRNNCTLSLKITYVICAAVSTGVPGFRWESFVGLAGIAVCQVGMRGNEVMVLLGCLHTSLKFSLLFAGLHADLISLEVLNFLRFF